MTQPPLLPSKGQSEIFAGEGVQIRIANYNPLVIEARRTPLPTIVEHYDWRRDARWTP